MIVDIAFGPIRLRSHGQTNSPLLKVRQAAPHARRYQDAARGAIHPNICLPVPVIHMHGKRTIQRKHNLGTRSVGMPTTTLPIWHAPYPKHTLHSEGYLTRSLQEGKTATFILILRQMYQLAATWQNIPFGLVIHHLSHLFTAKI